MKLSLQIKLLPTEKQAIMLKDTIKTFNNACNAISKIAWEKHVFKQFSLHHEVYYFIRGRYNLTSELTIRAINKVADSYKTDKSKQHIFRDTGNVIYDEKLLSYKDEVISISLIGGREKMSFACHRPDLMPFIKGQASLIYKKGKFFIYQAIDIQEEEQIISTSFIGVDMGLVDIVAISDGTLISSNEVKRVRKKYIKVRAAVESKGTRSCKRLLKRLSGRERRFATIVNHTISKQLTQKAKIEGKGIAIEELSNIRETSTRKVNKEQRKWTNLWSFYQLRMFLEYKCALNGIPFEVVNPAYTSQTCNRCFHIGERRGKKFKCTHCGNVDDADINAAKNIAIRGYVNTHEGWEGLSCSLYDNPTTSKAYISSLQQHSNRASLY